jgi:hypothetical protein
MVSLAFNFKIPGDVTVTAPVSTIAAPPFNVSVPFVTVVVPVYEFAPANVNSPVPAFVKFPLPLTTPSQFTALDTVTIELAAITPAPPKVNAPFNEGVESPNVTLAPIENAFDNTRSPTPAAPVLRTDTPAVPNVRVPLPSASSSPT